MMPPDSAMLLQEFEEFCDRLGVTEQLKQSKIPLDVAMFFVGCFVGLAKLPASPGYEPFLAQQGWNPLVARGAGYLAVRHGRRRAREAKYYRPVFDAIRFLGQCSRQIRAIEPRAKVILGAWKETSIIDTIFDQAGLSAAEFIGLLQAANAREPFDRKRLMQIAASLTPWLSLARGPKVCAPSAAQEFLLQNLGIDTSTKRRLPRRRDRTADGANAMTVATRREFGVPTFDSRSASRRINRSK